MPIGKPVPFRADTLYSQEPITNIDDHILINPPSAYVGFPRSEFGCEVNGGDHLLFGYQPPSPWGIEPVSSDSGADTGRILDPAGPPHL